MVAFDQGGRRGARRPTDRDLQLVVDGGYPDWEAIYDDNVQWVYSLMFGKVGNRHDAEDLTAEVFLAALRPLRVSASVPEVRAYLKATARTVLAAHWRHTMGREITTIEDDVAVPDLGTPVASRQAQDEALEMLSGLPDRYRRILELRFLHGMSVRDAAAELGVTIGNAKVLQLRALRMAAQQGEEAGRE